MPYPWLIPVLAITILLMALVFSGAADSSFFVTNEAMSGLGESSSALTQEATGPSTSTNSLSYQSLATGNTLQPDRVDVRPIVSASQILGQIRGGSEASYEGVLVKGDLDLSHLDVPVHHPLRIINSTLNGSLNLDGVTFEEELDLKGTEIRGNTSAASTTFSSDAVFTGAKFRGLVEVPLAKWMGVTSFKDVVFSGPADFTYAQFSKLVTFEGATFEREVAMSNARFMDDASFEKVRFLQGAFFQFCRFDQITSFWMSLFQGDVNFANTQIVGTANFLNVTWNGTTSFMGSNFGGDCTFSQSRFARGAIFGLVDFAGFSDFSKVKFDSVAIFAVSKFNDNARFVDATFGDDLILENSRIYTMQLENASFAASSQVNLKDADFTRMIARWSAIKEHLVFDGAAYLALVKNYRNLEWRDDANDCYYAYRRLSQAQEPWGFPKLVDIIAWLSCGYGVRPSYTILWAMIMIGFFGIIYWMGNGVKELSEIIEGARERGDDAGKYHDEGGGYQEDKGNGEGHDLTNSKSLPEEKPQGETPERKLPPEHKLSLADAMYYSAMTFTSQSPANHFPVGIYRHMTILEGLMGWFLLGLFIVVLSGTLIR